jgi:pilus assembly protein Flp/PilA
VFASSFEPKVLSFNPEEVSWMTRLVKLFTDPTGATAIEYGLIAALIAVVIIGAVTAVGTHLQTTFTTVSGKIA